MSSVEGAALAAPAFRAMALRRALCLTGAVAVLSATVVVDLLTLSLIHI